jgi:hypothetical protein
MKIEFRTIFLKKRFPLAISRGVNTGSDNLFVSISHQGITGWGELSPGKTEGTLVGIGGFLRVRWQDWTSHFGTGLAKKPICLYTGYSESINPR